MSLLWVHRGHVALASAVLEGTRTDYGSMDSSCKSSEFEDLRDHFLSTSTPHPQRGPTVFTYTGHRDDGKVKL